MFQLEQASNEVLNIPGSGDCKECIRILQQVHFIGGPASFAFATAKPSHSWATNYAVGRRALNLGYSFGLIKGLVGSPCW